jgi:hypothetical protein
MPKQRSSTRAGRAQQMLEAMEAGRSRSLYKQKEPLPLPEPMFHSICDRLELSERQREHFNGRPCLCLFMLQDVYLEFKRCVHVKGHSKGKADCKAQDVILVSLFDTRGNPMHEGECVKRLFGIGRTRFASVHDKAKVKHTVTVVRRDEVTEVDQRTGRVIAPPNARLHDGGIAWFANLEPHDPVELRIRRGHGLEGRPSNNAKPPDVLEDFREFVNANSAPNGRRPGTGHAEYYFAAHFSSVDRSYATTPKPGHYSLLEEFNKAQRAAGKESGMIGATTLARWLARFFSKHALCPHKSDYCDTCAEFAVQLHSAIKTLQRYRAGGTNNPAAAAEVERGIQRLRDARAEHLKEAERERAIYRTLIADANTAWADIKDPTEITSTMWSAAAIDYMQERPIPAFNLSPQPGCVYYLAKNSVHIAGVVLFHRMPSDPADGTRHTILYITDEREDGAKTNDHLLTYLELLLEHLPAGVRQLRLFGDNAATIKSRFIVGWAHDVITRGRLDAIELRFMIPGHTKFAPDQLFASLSRRLADIDLFDTSDLVRAGTAIANHAVEVGHPQLRAWRAALHAKYRAVPGIRTLRYLRIAKVDGTITVEAATSSDLTTTTTKTRSIVMADAAAAPVAPSVKPVLGLERRKLADLQLIYRTFVPEERWPAYIRDNEGPANHPAGSSDPMDQDG